MLQLILGRSGSGKTYEVQEEIVARVHAGENDVLLIVPEQFSFETERALLRRLGVQKANAVQVLSFTRMAETVAKECGGVSGRLMDKVTRTLLMSRALTQVADQLVLYRRHARRADYLKAVLDVVAECKQYAVTPVQLIETARRLPEGTLRQKLTELSCIMEAYGGLVAESYIDPADALTRLAEQLPHSRLGCGVTLFVDGFKGFTVQELQVMAVLMRRATRTVVTLDTDTLDARNEYALLAPVTKTANRFVQLARDQGVEVAPPRYLTENRRACHPALAVLEQNAFLPADMPYEENTNAVTVAPAADRYAECRLLTREIRRLLREEGWRCRDIAVVARNLPEYAGILDSALQAAGIPFYMDRREDVCTEPLMALMQCALRMAVHGYTADGVLQLMKTGLLGFSTSSIAKVEQYVYTWNIGGRRLCAEWTANPGGFSVKADEETKRQLSHLNRLRHRLFAPLERLANNLSEMVTGQVFARALYRYLEEARVARLVRLQAKRLHHAGDYAAADRMARMWDTLMVLLDRFGSALGTATMSAAQFEDLFSLAVSSTDQGSLPQGLDAVQVGSAERMRFSSPRMVWMLGANEGVFPAYPAVRGLISNRERRVLAEQGVSLSETGDHQAVEERLYAYLALAAPSERLYVSYLQHAGEQGSLPPSALVQTVTAWVPHHSLLTGEEMPESAGDAFKRLAEQFRTFTPERASLMAHFSANAGYAGRLQAMERSAEGAPLHFSSSQAAKDFFGERMTLSASQVETYHQCRFAYFCKYGLKVYAARTAQLGGLEFGNLAHFVMETVLPRYTAAEMKGVTRAVVSADTKAAVAEYIQEFMGGTEDKTARFLSLAARLIRTVECLLWQVVQELKQSRFVPVDYELPIGMEEGVPATVLTLPDGTSVRVIGKIDRVDVYHMDSVAYVRVVDYKTGAKEFRLSDVVEGINLQMLMYVFSLWDNGASRYGGTVTPAGVLYLPARLPLINAVEDDEQRAREQLRTMRMNGLLLDNPQIITAMEAEAGGLFVPAKLKKDGTPDSNSSVATLAQFGRLKQRVETLLREMVQTLHAGDVAAIPVNDHQTLDACAYCDYRAVCGHEAGDPVREIEKIDSKEVWARLERDFDETDEKM